MADGSIANEQITASSQRPGFEPWRARLRNIRPWGTAIQYPSSPWIQVHFKDKVFVTGIQTQGYDFTNSGLTYKIWVQTLEIQYGDRETDLAYITEGAQAMVSILIERN